MWLMMKMTMIMSMMMMAARFVEIYINFQAGDGGGGGGGGGGVFRISTDGDDRSNWDKNQNPKKSLGLPTNPPFPPKKNP